MMTQGSSLLDLKRTIQNVVLLGLEDGNVKKKRHYEVSLRERYDRTCLHSMSIRSRLKNALNSNSFEKLLLGPSPALSCQGLTLHITFSQRF